MSKLTIIALFSSIKEGGFNLSKLSLPNKNKGVCKM